MADYYAQTGKVIVAGAFHDYLPAGIVEARDEGYAPLVAEVPLAYAESAFVQRVAPLVDAATHVQVGIARRGAQRQAWDVLWTEEAFANLTLTRQIEHLYQTGESFWFQADDYLSRWKQRLVQDQNDPHVFYTVTYPIKPYAYTPLNALTFAGQLTVDGVVATSGYTINEEYGVVAFDSGDWSRTNVVRLSYTAKLPVRVARRDFRPVIPIAQSYYGGTVRLEQVDAPATDPWNVDLSDYKSDRYCGVFVTGSGQEFGDPRYR